MNKILLTDEQVQSFLIDGYLVLQTQLKEDVHKDIISKSMDILKEGNPGNNIYPMIPELKLVYDDPLISGALESLVGPNYTMQPHRFTHLNNPGSQHQQWHKDSFFGYGKPCRHHQTRYIMGMYYPQKTTIKMGPTALKPQSQYSSIDPKRYRGELENIHKHTNKKKDLELVCEAGTVLIIHYDIVHRGTANISEKSRLMFKFQFNRLEEPTKPSWDCKSTEWKMPKGGNKTIEPITKHVWNWLCGKSSEEKGDYKEFIKFLDDPVEDIRYYGAYSIALLGETDVLLKRFQDKNSEYRICAAYALTACGEKVVDGLIEYLKDDNEVTLILALFTLSEIGTKASKALPYVLEHLNNPSDYVRLYLTEALGNFGVWNQEVEKALLTLLSVKTEKSDHVRFTAALAIARLKPKEDDNLIDGLLNALKDSNRYARGNTLLALERIGSEKALKIIKEYKAKHKGLCPLTTLEKPW